MTVFPSYKGRDAGGVSRLLIVAAAILIVAAAILQVAAVPAHCPAASYDRAFLQGLEGYYARQASCGGHMIYYGDNGEKLAAEIDRILCASTGRIAEGVGLEEVMPIAVVIAPDTRAFRQLHRGRLPEWGEAFGDSGRMIMGVDASRILLSNRPLKTVVMHELSHLFLAQRTGRAWSPTWFVEGIAMRQSREWTLLDQWHLAVDVAKNDIPRLEDLQGRFPRSADMAATAYRISYAAVEELTGGEEGGLVTFTAFLRDTGDFEKAFELTYGETAPEFSGRFEAVMRSRYRTASMLLNISPYGLTLSLLFLAAYLIKRNRSRRRVREWEREDLGPGGTA